MNSSMSQDDEVHMNEIEVNSAVENVENRQRKRKRYYRHTPHQTQQMEAFFRNCPHPDKKQRNELSRELGMEPLQVKFWFQNKRTQMKAKHEHQQNALLRVENDKLRAENIRYKEALNNVCCPLCGHMSAIGDVSHDEHHLRLENAQLREEIGRISAIAVKYVGKPFKHSDATPSSSFVRIGAKDFEKSKNNDA